MKIYLDKFYTKKEVAKDCVSDIPFIYKYDKIVEPSAGNGSFIDFFENIEAYDLMPQREDIVEKDWFSFNNCFEGNTLIVGNPPFGERSSIAKKFIKQAIKLDATTIAFVLPQTFKKYKVQKSTFPSNWRLQSERILPKNSFFIFSNNERKEFHVPCVFQVWTKSLGSVDLRKNKAKPTQDFQFLMRGDKRADFTLNGNTGKPKLLKNVKNTKSEHYIKAKKTNKEDLFEIFLKMKIPLYSSVNGGNAWAGQQEILEAYNAYKK